MSIFVKQVHRPEEWKRPEDDASKIRQNCGAMREEFEVQRSH